MAAVTIRNLPDAVHRALKLRAAQHNRSTEAEMRAILEAVALPDGPSGLGTRLSEISRRHGVTNDDVEALQEILEQNRERDRTTREPIRFE